MADLCSADCDVQIQPSIPLKDMRSLRDPISDTAPAIHDIVRQASTGDGIHLTRDDNDGMTRLVLEYLGVCDKVGG